MTMQTKVMGRQARPKRFNHMFGGDSVKCPLCFKWTRLAQAECKHPTMPNTLTKLPDHNRVLWLCKHCGAWN